jgi:hypothetical protein
VSLFEPIFAALNRAEVRYVVVGGLCRAEAAADRPQDREDIEALQAILARKGRGDA